MDPKHSIIKGLPCTKFQGHRPFGSGGEIFFKVFTIYMDMAAILVM